MKKRFLNLFLFLSCSLFAAHSIEPTWSVDFGSVFDNREGDGSMYEAKTMFFTSLSPEVGLKFSPTDRIAGGAVWIQPVENKARLKNVNPVLYYRHEGEKWKFSMGIFPRTQLREPLPGFLWSDSLTYFQRNIRGALLQYENKNGFFDAYIDWRAHQTETQREAFNILFHGEVRPKGGHLLLGAHVLMNHFAKSRGAGSTQGVVDNFLVNPYIGLDYSGKLVLDSLVIKAGILQTIERHRLTSSGWNCPGGLWADATFEWRYLGVRNSFYIGGKQLLPLYGEFGPLLYQGEAYYQSMFYDRLDVYGRLYKNEYMDLEAQLNFNFAKDNFMFYQRLILNVYIGNLKKPSRRELSQISMFH